MKKLLTCMLYLCNELTPGHQIKTKILELINNYTCIPGTSSFMKPFRKSVFSLVEREEIPKGPKTPLLYHRYFYPPILFPSSFGIVRCYWLGGTKSSRTKIF